MSVSKSPCRLNECDLSSHTHYSYLYKGEEIQLYFSNKQSLFHLRRLVALKSGSVDLKGL